MVETPRSHSQHLGLIAFSFPRPARFKAQPISCLVASPVVHCTHQLLNTMRIPPIPP